MSSKIINFVLLAVKFLYFPIQAINPSRFSEYDILAIPEVHGKQTAYRFVLSKFMNDQSLQHVTSTVLPKELSKRKTPSKATPSKQAIVVDELTPTEIVQTPAETDVFATPKKATKKGKTTPAKNNTNVVSPPTTPVKSTDEASQSDTESTRNFQIRKVT